MTPACPLLARLAAPTPGTALPASGAPALATPPPSSPASKRGPELPGELEKHWQAAPPPGLGGPGGRGSAAGACCLGGAGPGAGKRGRRPACQRERARARVSAAPAPRRPRRRPPGLPPPPPALPAAWQAAGCPGGGSRRSHDLSGCLSSSGSYSFPARKQPGLLSEPPWPRGRRGLAPVWPPWAAPARPGLLPEASQAPRATRGGRAAGALRPPIWLHLEARRKRAAGCYRPEGVGKVN